MKRHRTLGSRQFNPKDNPAITKLMLTSCPDTERRAAWLEANKPPAEPPGSQYAVPARRRLSFPRRAETPEEWALQCLTWDYLRGQLGWQPALNTTWRSYAVEVATYRVNEGLRHIEALVVDGDANAVEAFAATTLDVVARLTRLADTQPDAFLPFARRQSHWPVLRSFHPHFDTNGEKSKELLERLEVGAVHPLNIYKGKWNPNDEVGKIAVEIYDRIESLRPRKSLFWPRVHLDQAEMRGYKLPDFGPTTLDEWFSVAKELVLRVWKTPEQVSRLNRLVKAPTRKVPSYKLRRVTRIHSHFFTMLKDKFRSMAGGNRD